MQVRLLKFLTGEGGGVPAPSHCPNCANSLSLPIQLTNYLQVPPHCSEEATQAMRVRQELQSCLGVHSTALFCTLACSI
jgi:hypothetical protein